MSIAGRFVQRFGSAPRIFRAPARVNLIGEHTDYNNGFVMPAAIDFTTWTAVAPNGTRNLRIWSENFGEEAVFPLDDPHAAPRGGWTDYVRGVAVMLMRAGHAIPGVDLAISGNVPLGAGLSSSASVEVSVARALLAAAGIDMPPVDVALLCQKAENEFAGARCGIMDQFAVCLGIAGHALLIDCQSLSHTPLPLPAGMCFVVSNTMVQRRLASGEYNRRREECEAAARMLGVQSLRDAAGPASVESLPEPLRRRARHVVTENARVHDAAAALLSGDLSAFGRAMNDSHASLRDDYEVSCPELDLLAALAQSVPGCYGSRMMGGGFGGCTISLVDENAVGVFRERIAADYRRQTGVDPDIHVCRASDGASEEPEE